VLNRNRLNNYQSGLINDEMREQTRSLTPLYDNLAPRGHGEVYLASRTPSPPVERGHTDAALTNMLGAPLVPSTSNYSVRDPVSNELIKDPNSESDTDLDDNLIKRKVNAVEVPSVLQRFTAVMSTRIPVQ
jgi:hypothetical protein